MACVGLGFILSLVTQTTTIMFFSCHFFRKNPNQVDTRTVRVLMEVAELHRKHLGGQLLFSPDGLLHIILGDGMITLDDMEEMDGLRWDQSAENGNDLCLFVSQD